MPISRRTLIVGGVAGVAALGYGGFRLTEPEPTRSPAVSADEWISSRTVPYFIGHRGSGGVVPEHTVEGYEFALAQGLPAIEMSVGISSDAVVYCMHDQTLDRTTTLRGTLSDYTSSEIDRGRVRVPRLGVAWTGSGMPRIPRLEDALAAVGRRAVLCIEAKSGDAFEPMLRLIQDQAAMGTVILKGPLGSPTIEAAHKIDAPVFAYLGAGEDVNATNLGLAGRTLDRERDVLVIPTRDRGSFVADALVKQAVGQGPPVWVYSTHRRSEVHHYQTRGIAGYVTTMAGYTSTATSQGSSDTWATGRVAPGLMTRDPYSDGYALRWPGDGVVAAEAAGASAYLTMGDLCPIDVDRYEITVEAGFSKPPRSGVAGTGIGLVVATTDDASPQAEGRTSGYECIVGSDGTLSIRSNDSRDPIRPGSLLGERRGATAPRVGAWGKLSVTVDASSVTLSWGGQSIRVEDRRWRGGYFHIGRTGPVGGVALRKLNVATR